MPLLTRYFIDHILPRKEVRLLFIMIAGLFGFMIFNAFVQYWTNYLKSYIGQKIGMDIKLNLYKHIVGLPIDYFEKNTSGYISTRIIGDSSSVQGLVVDTLSNLLRDGLTFIVGFIAIFLLSWKLALASLIALPFYIWFTYFYSKKMRESSYKVREESAKLSGFLNENLLGVRLMKEFQMESWGLMKFFKVLKHFIRKSLHLASIRFKFLSGIMGINGVAPLIVLGYGGYLVMMGNITLGTLVAFTSFLGYLYAPILGLMSLNQRIQEAMASVDRINEILGKDIEERKGRNIKLKGSIEFKDVVFSRKERKILDGVNFKIEEGENVLIKGKSGEGKTTIVNLLFGYYKPEKGKIKIGEKDICEISLQSLRKGIGYLSQDVLLFTGSFLENIVLNMDIEDDTLKRIIVNAGLEDTIKNLPLGLDTEVGEMGYTLSGGERKRVGLVRVFLKDAPVVVLDETYS